MAAKCQEPCIFTQKVYEWELTSLWHTEDTQLENISKEAKNFLQMAVEDGNRQQSIAPRKGRDYNNADEHR